MTGRDRHEPHRVATPLELFFDLIFVVAVAASGAQLHHGLAAGHPSAVIGFAMAFLATWWAWMGFTWFSSAYDNDDAVYRLLAFTIMAGALIFAASVPDLFDDGQSRLTVIGYAVMRMGQVALWLRAARDHPEGRRTPSGSPWCRSSGWPGSVSGTTIWWRPGWSASCWSCRSR